MQPDDKQKTLTDEKLTQRLIQCLQRQDIGSSGGRKKFSTCPERIFQSVTWEKLDDQTIKSSPNLTKLCRHDHKGLVNTSTKGIDESLQGLGWIAGLVRKNRVLSRTQKLRIDGTRDSVSFSPRLDELESQQRVTWSTKTTSSTRIQESTKENQISHEQATRSMRLKWIQQPRGHKEERASFPNQFPYKDSKIHGLDHLLEKKREEEPEGRWERRLEQGFVFYLMRRQPEREPAPLSLPTFYPSVCCYPAFLSSPPSLPLKTRIPLSAEIKLEGP